MPPCPPHNSRWRRNRRYAVEKVWYSSVIRVAPDINRVNSILLDVQWRYRVIVLRDSKSSRPDPGGPFLGIVTPTHNQALFIFLVYGLDPSDANRRVCPEGLPDIR